MKDAQSYNFHGKINENYDMLSHSFHKLKFYTQKAVSSLRETQDKEFLQISLKDTVLGT